LLLGGQLATLSVGEYWRPALAASGISLIIAPIIAFGLAALLGLSGPTRQAAILEASMPAAVIITIIATEYEAEPKLVTATVIVSTLISPITLTLLIAMLK
jgi:predicted permease